MLMFPRGSTYSILFRRLITFSSQVSPAAMVELLAYRESVKSSRTNFGCNEPIGSSPSRKIVCVICSKVENLGVR